MDKEKSCTLKQKISKNPGFLLLVLLPLFGSSSFIEYQIIPPENPAGLRQKQVSSCLPPHRAAPEQYRVFFESASREEGIPQEILENIAWAESRFKPWAISSLREDGSRDMGMFQLNSSYQSWFEEHYNAGNPFNPLSPKEAVTIASRHIKWLYERYGHWPDVVMAYNAGYPRIDSGNIPEGAWKYLMAIYSGRR